MKIVVIGGTGLIGSNLVSKLKNLGIEAVAASPSKGVNTITGEGLTHALENANVVIDVTNAPSFEEKAVLEFFKTSTLNLIAAEKQAGVSHHIALSVIGTDQNTESGYLKAKLVQENLIRASSIPYTIVRSTQFFEFLDGIAQAGTINGVVHLSPAYMQPIAAQDVVSILLQIALEDPINGIIEIAGPERYRISDIVQQYLKAKKDSSTIVQDDNALYFGAKLTDDTLTPKGAARLGTTNFKSWLDSSLS